MVQYHDNAMQDDKDFLQAVCSCHCSVYLACIRPPQVRHIYAGQDPHLGKLGTCILFSTLYPDVCRYILQSLRCRRWGASAPGGGRCFFARVSVRIWGCPRLIMGLQIRTEEAVVILAQIPLLPAGMQHCCTCRDITSQLRTMV